MPCPKCNNCPKNYLTFKLVTVTHDYRYKCTDLATIETYFILFKNMCGNTKCLSSFPSIMTALICQSFEKWNVLLALTFKCFKQMYFEPKTH